MSVYALTDDNRAMFIQTEAAPDENVMRFFPGRAVLDSGTAEFPGREAAGRSPLATELFAIDGVKSVAFDCEYVTVTKDPDARWQVLKPQILGIIMEHFVAGRPVIDMPGFVGGEGPSDESEESKTIREIMDSRIRPGLRDECGEVRFVGYDDGVVRLAVESGAFSKPLFAIKVKIENTLRYYVPSVIRVEFERTGDDGVPADQDRPGLQTPEGQAIHQLLEERINPAIAMHGGHITLIDVEGERAYLRLEGGCQGCGMADVTLKQGVEGEIMRAVPSIREVLDVTDHAAGTNPYYQPSRK